MKRRDFVVGFSSVALLSVTGTYFYSNRNVEYDPVIAEPFFLSHIWDNESIVNVGKKYLSGVKDEKDEQELVKHIVMNNDPKESEGIQKINEQIAVDFNKDQIVLVDGWILSLTEARQCGLYSLITDT